MIDGSLPDQMIKDMIEDSYDLVVSKLPPAHRRALGWHSAMLTVVDRLSYQPLLVDRSGRCGRTKRHRGCAQLV
jgi:hypothetical protein